MKSDKSQRGAVLKRYFLRAGVICSLALFNLLAIGLAQNTQTTANKADQNLKSVARVNPSTLAMEFSLPLGEYPGRDGNSVPIALNYSSKVWTMKKVNSRFVSVWANEDPTTYDYRAYVSTDVGGYFGEKSTAGWTSSLQPPIILGEFEDYDQYGNLLDFFVPESLCNQGPTAEGQFCHETTPATVTAYHPSCNGLAWVTGTVCCVYGLGCSVVESSVSIECISSGPIQTPTPVGSPTPNYPEPPVPPQQIQHHVPRVRVQMPDGSSHEFRKDDVIYNCATQPANCGGENNGTYLSVDGSGMRLERQVMVQPENELRDVLHLPNGDRYIFPISGQSISPGTAERFVDASGNTSAYDATTHTWTDTLGREIADPFLNVFGVQPLIAGTQPYVIKGIDDEDLTYSLTWSRLEDVFEDPANMETKKAGQDSCLNELPNPVTGDFLFANQPVGPGDDNVQGRVKYIRRTRMCASSLGWGNVNPFNPLVLAGITYPNGQKYQFKYNEFGEISKIIYPTGGYDRFVYGQVMPIGVSAMEVYVQGNRGVHQRFVSVDGVTETQPWTYLDFVSGETSYGTTTIAPDGSKTERLVYHSDGSTFGFEEPRAGMTKEERVKDPNGVVRSRTLTEWDVTPPQGTGAFLLATRDPRPARTISIIFENQQALATMSETEYETPGENDSTAPADLSYFARLNAKQSKSYHYLPLTPAEANAAYASAIVDIKNKFYSQGQVARISQTDYSYDPDYKAGGIIGLPIETRMMDPTNPTNPPLAITQTIYDNQLPGASEGYPGSYDVETYNLGDDLNCGDSQNPKICWQSPPSNRVGRSTTSRVWHSESQTWIESHTRHDVFGNPIAGKDPIGNETSTEFSSTYKYAYPTKVIAPAPDPTNTGTGTNLTSTAETTYDFTSGLPLTVKDDFEQITRTEYDTSSRPWRVFADNFTAPETQTIYGVPNASGQFPADQRFVKVRKQIDANNWDEATTWFDGLGRTIKTQAKDSQGDVFVETVYDAFGRVERVTNPYCVGDTVYWTKTRYDAAGRAVESYAPATLAEINTAATTNNANLTSLGVTSFAISDIENYVGTVVTTTDASGRNGRSVTNALGQLIRVDEPDKVTGELDANGVPIQPTSYKYDHYGKMVEVTQGAQKRWFKYDSLGRLLRVRQPEQEINTSLATTGNPDNNSWTAGFVYDVLGNVIRATDANGVNIINEYDKAGRVTKRCYTKPNITLASTVVLCSEIPPNDRSSDTSTVENFYDGEGLDALQTPHNFAKGKLTKVKNGVSQTRYIKFDNLGRLEAMEQRTPVGDETFTNAPARTSKYTYNFSGALIEEEYPSGRKVKNEFEPDGDLLRVTSKKAGSQIYTPYVSNFSYTASGGISQMRLGNGKWETAKFNTRLQVYELGLGNSATNAGIWKVNYEYGELQTSGNVDATKNTGNIGKQTLTIPGATFVQTYKYDSLYRLREAVEPSGGATPNWSQTFDYDRFGNRTSFSQTIGGATTHNTTPAVDNMNRFTSTDFDYDNNGNIVSDIDPVTSQTRLFTFNGDNKQTEVIQNGVPIGRYFYDGEGRRVKKVTNTETTIFVYSAGKLVAEYSTQLAEQPSTNYTTTDHLGTPRIITNELGQVKARRDFMPFGEELANTGSARSANAEYSNNADEVRQKFTGYQKDGETSLDFAEARMYENRHGRFTAVDPLLASGQSANPQTFNRYVYVMNGPLDKTDKSGMVPDWIKESCGHNCFRPRWVDREATAEERWENTTFITSDTKDLIQLFANGPSDVPDVGYMAGYAKNGVVQGTGLYSIPEASKNLLVGYFSAQLKAAPNAVIDIANFGLWGMSPAPSAAPQIPRLEYTSTTEKVVGYPTEFALGLVGGGASATKLPSVVTAIKEGGVSFSAYKAARGGSEILGHIPTVTRSGKAINYAIQTEYSHMFITQAAQRRYNIPNWLVNNPLNLRKLNTIQHALIDPQRFKFLPVGLKSQVGFSPSAKYNFFTKTFK